MRPCAATGKGRGTRQASVPTGEGRTVEGSRSAASLPGEHGSTALPARDVPPPKREGAERSEAGGVDGTGQPIPHPARARHPPPSGEGLAGTASPLSSRTPPDLIRGEPIRDLSPPASAISARQGY